MFKIKEVIEINNYKNEIRMEITQDLVDEYTKEYFRKHPNRKKKPIDKPVPPNLNRFMVMKRPQANDVKQKWKDFAIWIINKYGYVDKLIESCKVKMIVHRPTKRLCDIDNFSTSCKFLFDGFSQAGLWVDDNYSIVHEISTSVIYNKGIEQLDIIINYN